MDAQRYGFNLQLLKRSTDFQHKIKSVSPEYSRESWMKEKFTLGLDYTIYYISGDIKVTQSNAILHVIARKHNLCGETEKERSIVDMMAEQYFSAICPSVRNKKENKKTYLNNVPKTIEAISDFLGEKNYLAGDKALPKIAEYMKSDKFMTRPINNPMAVFR
ncbi:glutathione S-transferase Mu 2-like [Exaiptasia diaphana]|uniref:glutathione transferase n=1 Tax=Exaiptasia diaphana TaxID=2652724 RepID=A0A913YWB4_EXADI|nr:glutathione S-transferase Mu 2-like [Exaiptasia diaphana]